uniref:Uncharacterized protein n=1 Tax=Leersia perrieri TaxID=77586 RepID=A0A0D9XCL3_9ORYZ
MVCGLLSKGKSAQEATSRAITDSLSVVFVLSTYRVVVMATGEKRYAGKDMHVTVLSIKLTW